MSKKERTMSLSEHDFNEELDEVVESTMRLLHQNEHDEYPPVAFLSGKGDLDVMSIDDEEEGSGDVAEADLPQLAREFGESLAAERRPMPECVFFAHHAKAEDGTESIVVHGATPEGLSNNAYLALSRDAANHLRVTSSKAWHSPVPLAPPVNLAAELLKGLGVKG